MTEIFTHTLTGIDAISLTYTGAATTTCTIATSTLTVTRDGTPTAYDLTNTSYDTITELVAVLDAVADLACSAETLRTWNPSKYLTARSATAMTSGTALTLTMDTRYFSAAVADLGEEIRTNGHTGIVLYAKIDINDTVNPRFKILAKHTYEGADKYVIPHSTIISANTTAEATNENYVELDSDTDQNIVMIIPNLYGADSIQVQIYAGTAGASPGLVTELKYSYIG